MISKTITYPGYDGVEYTDTFYFDLMGVEIAEIQFTTAGGDLEAWINEVASTRDSKRLWELFSEMIAKSYGRPEIGGPAFQKKDSWTRRFKQTQAYNNLMEEILMDEKSMSNFINGVVGRPVVGDKKPQDHKKKEK